MPWYKSLKLAASDAKINFLSNRYKIPVEKVQELLPYDVGNRGIYLEWLVKQVAQRQLRFPEDGEKVIERLTQFSKLKNSPRFSAAKDINQYKTFGDLAQTVDQTSGSVSKKEEFRTKSEDGAEFILDYSPPGSNEKYDVIKITTPEASSKWCKGTEWCVKDPVYFEQYGMGPDSPLYMFLINGKKAALLHKDSNQFMDPYDRRLDRDELKRYFSVAQQSKELESAVGNFILSTGDYRMLENAENLSDDLRAGLAYKNILRKPDDMQSIIASNPILQNDPNFWAGKIQVVRDGYGNGYGYGGASVQEQREIKVLIDIYKSNLSPGIKSGVDIFIDNIIVRGTDRHRVDMMCGLKQFGPEVTAKLAEPLKKLMKNTSMWDINRNNASTIRDILGSEYLKMMLERHLVRPDLSYMNIMTNTGYVERGMQIGFTPEELAKGFDVLTQTLQLGLEYMDSQGWNVSNPQFMERKEFLKNFRHVMDSPQRKNVERNTGQQFFTLWNAIDDKIQMSMEKSFTNMFQNQPQAPQIPASPVSN